MSDIKQPDSTEQPRTETPEPTPRVSLWGSPDVLLPEQRAAPNAPQSGSPTFDWELDEPTLNKDGTPRKEGSGRPLGATDKDARTTRTQHFAVARLHALGLRNTQIAERTGYTQERISQILAMDHTKEEIRRYRSQLYDQDLTSALKDIGKDAIQVVHKMVLDDEQKLRERVEAAKWVLEKVTGKPKQEVQHESNTLAAFMDMMKGMSERGETLDVTPQTAEPREAGAPEVPAIAESGDRWTHWVADNLE